MRRHPCADVLYACYALCYLFFLHTYKVKVRIVNGVLEKFIVENIYFKMCFLWNCFLNMLITSSRGIS